MNSKLWLVGCFICSDHFEQKVEHRDPHIGQRGLQSTQWEENCQHYWNEIGRCLVSRGTASRTEAPDPAWGNLLASFSASTSLRSRRLGLEGKPDDAHPWSEVLRGSFTLGIRKGKQRNPEERNKKKLPPFLFSNNKEREGQRLEREREGERRE